MWNLRVGVYGKIVKLGNESGILRAVKLSRKLKKKKKKTNKLSRKAKNVYHLYFELEKISTSERFNFLSQSQEKGSRIPNGLLKQRRKEFDKNKKSLLSLRKSICYVCESNNDLVRHHVIPLHRGGSNSPKNLVPLCNNCHERLHPWLIQKPGDDQGNTTLPNQSAGLSVEKEPLNLDNSKITMNCFEATASNS